MLVDGCQGFSKHLMKIVGCRSAHRAEELERAQWEAQGRGAGNPESSLSHVRFCKVL